MWLKEMSVFSKVFLNSSRYESDILSVTPNWGTWEIWEQDCITSSAQQDHTNKYKVHVGRYMSLKENKYIRYFGGHDKRVVTLAMNPADDTFLSGSMDKSIRLWDLRSNHCQGLMKLAGRPVAAFDPDGLIFAAGINSESVKLYDLRSFDKGPFSSFKLQGTLLYCNPKVDLSTNINLLQLIAKKSSGLGSNSPPTENQSWSLQTDRLLNW